MIRFTPDSLRDALLRPLAMAAPDAWVYVEIMAPDFRFLFALLLAAGVALQMARGRGARASGVWPLAVFCGTAFVVWLLSSGNGRYALPLLIVIGPLSVALITLQAWTRELKLTAALAMILLQGFLLVESAPFGSWAWSYWREGPAFHVSVPEDLRRRPSTYVTISSISYSLLAPAFHRDSRWINLSSIKAGDDRSRAGIAARKFLEEGENFQLVMPSVWDAGVQPLTISKAMHQGVNRLLVRHGFEVQRLKECRYLPSDGLSMMGVRWGVAKPGKLPRAGFWLCPIDRVTPVFEPPAAKDPIVEAAFARVERACPRYFPPGGAQTLPIPNGALRIYADSDMKLYILEDGRVLYKYLRSLNMQSVGSVIEVAAGRFRLDCDRLRGRSGLPWQREL